MKMKNDILFNYASYPFLEENYLKLKTFFPNKNDNIKKYDEWKLSIFKKKELFKSCGLDIVNQSFLDLAREKDTINGKYLIDCNFELDDEIMPIIRKSNILDISIDKKIENCEIFDNDYELLNINESRLETYLKSINLNNLLIDRDSHIICSSQIILLPFLDNLEPKINFKLYSPKHKILVIYSNNNNLYHDYSKTLKIKTNQTKNTFIFYIIPMLDNNKRDPNYPIRCIYNYFFKIENNKIELNDVKDYFIPKIMEDGIVINDESREITKFTNNNDHIL